RTAAPQFRASLPAPAPPRAGVVATPVRAHVARAPRIGAVVRIVRLPPAAERTAHPAHVFDPARRRRGFRERADRHRRYRCRSQPRTAEGESRHGGHTEPVHLLLLRRPCDEFSTGALYGGRNRRSPAVAVYMAAACGGM